MSLIEARQSCGEAFCSTLRTRAWGQVGGVGVDHPTRAAKDGADGEIVVGF